MLMSHLAKSLVIILRTYPTGSHLDVRDNRNGVVMKVVSGLNWHALPSLYPENLPSAGHEEPTQQNHSSGAFPGPRLSSPWYLCLLVHSHASMGLSIDHFSNTEANGKYRFLDSVSTNVHQIIPVSWKIEIKLHEGVRFELGLRGADL